jgi:hypothetical protein
MAILRTVLYADVFNFPMTVRELQHFLIHDTPVPLSAVETVLASGNLSHRLDIRDGYVVRHGRRDLIPLRMAREQASEQLMPQALRYAVWLSRLPFVRLVALTGALAMRNAPDERDDLDYMLVTAPRRVWLARAFSILLVRVVKLRGIVLCPNYVLAESALVQERQDLFIAHEIAQMVPVYGQALYRHLRDLNRWALTYLPNTEDTFYPLAEPPMSRFWQMLKGGIERVLGGWLGDTLETWEQRRKLRRFAGQMQTPHSAARLDEQHVKGHFNDHGHVALEMYRARLREYGLEAEPSPMPGD